RPTQGQPCLGGTCATGLFCSGGTCMAQLGQGQTCSSTIQCQTGLFCDFAANSCQALHRAGEVCTSTASGDSSQCIPGTCAGSTQTCFRDGDCSNRCSNNNNTCFQDSQCGAGTCSITATTCTVPNDCVGVGNTCVFPNKCNPGDCVGDVVCADKH